MPLRTANFAFGRLSQAAAAGDISISIRPTDPLTSFPTLGPDDWTYAVIFAEDGNPGEPEVIRIDAINNNVLSVVRGVGNTVARAWAAGDRVELRMVAEIVDDVRSPPPPVFLSQADYDRLDPVDPNTLYGIQEVEERDIPPDTLITGPRVLRALRSLPQGQGLTGDDVGGLAAAIRAVLAADVPLTLDGGLIAECAIPAAADYTDGDAIAAARWTVAPSQRSAWTPSATNGDMAWNLFTDAGAAQHRPTGAVDGWWAIVKLSGIETDRVHIPGGLYGQTPGTLNVELMAGPTDRLRLWAWKAAPVAGPPALAARVLVSVRGAGTAVAGSTTLELREYRVAVAAGG